MTELRLHGSSVETVFDLLGHNENDMTFALGWGLSRSPAVLRRFLARVAASVPEFPAVIELQGHDDLDRGFTDIEILTPVLHVIVEAKRGWEPPSAGQLERYGPRFAAEGRLAQRFVILTQNGTEQIVRNQLGSWQPPSPSIAEVVGWADIVNIAARASREGSLAERRLSSELAAYLRGVADMRNTESNSVYVVSLGAFSFPGWPPSVTAIDIVEKQARYFFPATGKNWPKTPPNYIAFRYWGKLQSIHHVDDSEIFENPGRVFPGVAGGEWGPHFLLKLGPAIRPDREVRTGPGIVRSSRVWVDIDLLLTSATITEAAQTSRARKQGTA